MEPPVNITLDTVLPDRGVHQLFAAELKKVLDNVYDPNADPKKARELNLKFQFKPGADPTAPRISVQVSSKLAPENPVSVQAFVNKFRGEIVCTVVDPRQRQIQFDEQSQPVALDDARHPNSDPQSRTA